MSQLFVMLQRPLPVMRSFLPSRGFRSSKRTDLPYRPAAMQAAVIPAAPPPMIIRSWLIKPFLFGRFFFFTVLVDMVFRPDVFQMVEGGHDLFLLLQANGGNEGVNEA